MERAPPAAFKFRGVRHEMKKEERKNGKKRRSSEENRTHRVIGPKSFPVREGIGGLIKVSSRKVVVSTHRK